MGVALAFLRIAWPYLLSIAVVLGIYAWDNNRCNSACTRQKALVAEAATTISSLKGSIAKGNQDAAEERARLEAVSKSAAADASVRLAAAQVVADNATADATRLLAANRDLLRRIALPNVVRDAYNAGIRQQAGSGTDTGQVSAQSGSSATAPLTLDEYATVCTQNAIAQNHTADDYDALYEYTEKLWNAYQRKESQ